MRDVLAQTVTVGIHFVFLGVVTWVTASPFLFPSLGPSAYLLAAGENENPAASGPYHVIGGHLIATVSGLVGYHTFATGLTITTVVSQSAPATSLALVQLGASSIVAMMLTTLGMLVLDTNHPAACATTLIVSLGVLSTLVKAGYIMLAVITLVGTHELVIYPMMQRMGVEPESPR
jgi:CBS-domain-containing membrane protein